jgi:hypothetical protein
MNDYKLETLNDDLTCLIYFSKELSRIKKAVKEEKKAYGKVTETTKSLVAEILTAIGERATGISQLGMNDTDPDIQSVTEEIIK